MVVSWGLRPCDILYFFCLEFFSEVESSLKHFPFFWSWLKFVLSLSAAVFKGLDFDVNGALWLKKLRLILDADTVLESQHGKVDNIHSKHSVHSAKSCCTATTMAFTSNKQKVGYTHYQPPLTLFMILTLTGAISRESVQINFVQINKVFCFLGPIIIRDTINNIFAWC